MAVLVASLLSLGACTRTRPPDIVLILIDTLRADRVGWYGSQRGLTPFLDSLGSRGTVFWNAYAQSSWTSPSMATLFTSRFPSQHGVNNYQAVLAADETTLAERLQAHGYVRGAFVANRLLNERHGWTQGYDAYETLPPELSGQPPSPFAKARADVVNAAGLAWLDTLALAAPARPPVFLYLHYMEPHVPYTPPEPIARQIMSRRGRVDEEWATFGRMLFTDTHLWTAPDAAAFDVIVDLYDAEVLSLDAQLRELFAGLAQRGLLANAIVIVAADHGEELQDHGRLGHGTTLYNEVIHVPLLVIGPGQTERRDVHRLVSLVDIVPTVLALAAVQVPADVEGASLEVDVQPSALGAVMAYLRNLRSSTGVPSDAVFSQLVERAAEPKRHDAAVVLGHEKLIAAGESLETYDLEADPAETHNDAVADRQALTDTFDAFTRLVQQRSRRERVDQLDQKTEDAMRALGYGDQ